MSTVAAPRLSVGGSLMKTMKEKGLNPPEDGKQPAVTQVAEPPAPAKPALEKIEPVVVQEVAKPVEQPPVPAKPTSKVFGTEEPKPITPAPAKEKPPVDEKAERKWAEMRTNNETLQLRVSELERANKELAEKSNQDSELPSRLAASEEENKTLKARLDEYEQELSVAAVERTKDFTRDVTEPKTRVTSQAEAIATKYGLNPKSLLSALREPVETRNDVLDEIFEGAAMKGTDRQDLLMLSRHLDDLETKAEAKRTEARTKRDQTLLTHKSEQEAASKDRSSKAVETLRNELSEASKRHGFLSAKTGDTTWDQWYASQVMAAEKANLDDPVVIGAGQAAVVQLAATQKGLEHYKNLLEQSQAKATLLEERLSKFEGLSPEIKGGNGHDAPSAPASNGLSVGQRIVATAARAGRL